MEKVKVSMEHNGRTKTVESDLLFGVALKDLGSGIIEVKTLSSGKVLSNEKGMYCIAKKLCTLAAQMGKCPFKQLVLLEVVKDVIEKKQAEIMDRMASDPKVRAAVAAEMFLKEWGGL